MAGQASTWPALSCNGRAGVARARAGSSRHSSNTQHHTQPAATGQRSIGRDRRKVDKMAGGTGRSAGT
jgi:hypothetical protein